MNLILQLLLNLPGPIIRLLAGGRVVKDGQEMDKQSQMMNYILAKIAKVPLEEQTAEANRATMNQLSKHAPPSPVKNTKEILVPGPMSEIPVRIYQPDLSQPGGVQFDPNQPSGDQPNRDNKKGGPADGPAVIYFHGGGWVLGDLESHDYVCGELARQTQCKVFAVDYRLAPEHPYPASMDDCYAAFQFIANHAEEFGIDATKLAVAGDSAGGNLAAAVCQRNKSQRSTQACFQLLVYPVTDLSKESKSYQTFADGFMLTSSAMRWFIDQYAPDRIRRREPLMSPLLEEDLGGLPPALVIVAGFDPLRDEGLDYAQKLQAAGIDVQREIYPSTFHGFFGIAPLNVSKRAITLASDALQKAFSTHIRKL